MELYDLAFCCFIYYWNGNEDVDYLNFLKETDSVPDLNNDKHRESLLRFLNQWQCRQLAKYYYQQASEKISSWYQKYDNLLPPRNKNLLELMENDFELIKQAYGDLKKSNLQKFAPLARWVLLKCYLQLDLERLFHGIMLLWKSLIMTDCPPRISNF